MCICLDAHRRRRTRRKNHELHREPQSQEGAGFYRRQRIHTLIHSIYFHPWWPTIKPNSSPVMIIDHKCMTAFLLALSTIHSTTPTVRAERERGRD